MSKIVTFEQAERLENIGFDRIISHYYELENGKWGITNTLDKDFKDFFIRYPDERSIIRLAPTVSEALDFIREKGTVCYVDVVYNVINKKAMYLGKILSESGLIIQKKTSDFDTHSLAESALLDAVLTYLENK